MLCCPAASKGHQRQILSNVQTKKNASADSSSFSFPSLTQGSSPHQNRQASVACGDREVLPSSHTGFPHQQEDLRRGRHHPFQAIAQQDCRIHDAFDEEDSARACSWYQLQAAGGGEGEEGQLRSCCAFFSSSSCFVTASAFLCLLHASPSCASLCSSSLLVNMRHEY